MITTAALSAQHQMLEKKRKPREGALTPAHEQARAALGLPTEKPGDDQPPNAALRDDAPDEQDAEAARLHDGIEEDKGMATAAKSKRTLPGDADSPGRDIPVRSSHLPATLGGKVSQRSLGGVSYDFVDNQALGPKMLATLRAAGPDASGSSLDSAAGSVTVHSLNQAAASANIPLPGSPLASPNRHDFRPASSGHGQRFGKTPSRPTPSGS